MTIEQKPSEARSWVAQTFACQKVPKTTSGRGCGLSRRCDWGCSSADRLRWDGEKPLATPFCDWSLFFGTAKAADLENQVCATSLAYHWPLFFAMVAAAVLWNGEKQLGSADFRLPESLRLVSPLSLAMLKRRSPSLG